MNKTIVVGVTGSIAAFKSLELVRELKKEGLNVEVVMTKSAARIIPAEKFQKASGKKVYLELFEKDFNYQNVLKKREVEHIELAKKADVVVIAPATANIIAKIANGIADDCLTTTILATTAPVIICPAMNTNMWNNPLTCENISKLKKLGFLIIEPTSGMLACGDVGKGKLMEISQIKKEVLTELRYTQNLKGKRIIVTSGATSEKIDAVRYITNRSSGKMGIAIAEECKRQGADILLLRSKNSKQPRYLIKEQLFSSTNDLLNLVRTNVKNYDYFYHAAAVSDFSVKNPKIGKLSSTSRQKIELEPQIKIIDEIKKFNPKIHLIGFKTIFDYPRKDQEEAGRQKLLQSKADAIIVNDISKNGQGFESDFNEVLIVSPKNALRLPLATKTDLARKIVALLN